MCEGECVSVFQTLGDDDVLTVRMSPPASSESGGGTETGFETRRCGLWLAGRGANVEPYR